MRIALLFCALWVSVAATAQPRQAPPGPMTTPDPLLAWQGNKIVWWTGSQLKPLLDLKSRTELLAPAVVSGSQVVLVTSSQLVTLDLSTNSRTATPIRSGTASRVCPPVLAGEALVWFTGTSLERIDLETGATQTLAADVVKPPFRYCTELAIQPDGNRVSLTLSSEDPEVVHMSCDPGIPECWDEQEEAASRNQESVLVVNLPASALTTKMPPTATPPPPTCTWVDAVPANRPSLSVFERGGKWVMGYPSLKAAGFAPVPVPGAFRNETPAALRRCLKEAGPEEGEEFCEDVHMPKLEGCRWMEQAPHEVCAMGAGYSDAYTIQAVVWSDQGSGAARTRSAADEGGGLGQASPSGCWFGSDAGLLGPVKTPPALSKLTFLAWLPLQSLPASLESAHLPGPPR